jgi:hypothetical protein
MKSQMAIALVLAAAAVEAQRQQGPPVKLHTNDLDSSDAKMIDRVSALGRVALGPDAVKSSAVHR